MSIKTITIYAPPTIAVTISPTTGPISNTLTLSGTITNPGPASLTYQWQRSTDSTTWTNIPGITSEDYTGTVNFPSSGTQYVRMQATGTGGVGTSNVVTYEAIRVPVFTSVTIDPATGEIPLTVSLSATATGATSFKWQKLIGGCLDRYRVYPDDHIFSYDRGRPSVQGSRWESEERPYHQFL